MKLSRVLPISIVIIVSLFLFGCISEIEEHDKLNSKIDFDLAEHMQSSIRIIDKENPCTCMLCTKATDTGWYNLFGLFDWFKTKKDVSLEGAECSFNLCNPQELSKVQNNSDIESGEWALCNVEGEEKSCSPRFFMLGVGASSSEFSLGQNYCMGEMTMPVIWTVSQDDEPPIAPDPTTMMCHISKSQMPVVVWYTKGKYIDDPSYTKMLKSFYNLSANPKISGPIMVTTEALVDPYYIDSEGSKKLNISLLSSVEKQLNEIDKNCPKCLSVLALKPTFDENGLPDLCPIEYFIPYRRAEVGQEYDVLNCSNKYPSEKYYYDRQTIIETTKIYEKIDILGIAFNSNDNENMITCNPQKSFLEHMQYSRSSLSEFYLPSVWYSVAMSVGPTKTSGCTFSEYNIEQGYLDLIRGIPGFVSSGIIGVAIHRLMDVGIDDVIECTQMYIGKTVSVVNVDEIVFEKRLDFETDEHEPLIVKNIISKRKDLVQFEAYDKNIYIAYLDNENKVSINSSACQFGLLDFRGVPKDNSHYLWFSNCQYYYTDKGPLFKVKTDLSKVRAGEYIRLDDDQYSLYVEKIESTKTDEKIFIASNDYTQGKFSAKKDGESIIIYDLPYTWAYQQPLMFSTNLVGLECNAFDSSKMLYRQTIAQMPNDIKTIPDIEDDEIKEDILKSKCSNCIANTPMPIYFCKEKEFLEENAQEIGKKGWGVSLSMPSGACTQYKEIDTVFMKKSFDSVFMRSIAAGESALGRNVDYGIGAPACAMSSARLTNTNCNADNKITSEYLKRYPSKYCGVNDIYTISKSIENSFGKVCAMGLFQCIDKPNYSYNPFEPVDSASCGLDKFSTYYNQALKELNSAKKSDPNLDMFNYAKGGIMDSDIEWYAAWLGAYKYSGMGNLATISLLKKYTYNDVDDNIVSYMHRELEKKCESIDGYCYPYYGSATIIRYNDAIKKCASGCLYRSC